MKDLQIVVNQKQGIITTNFNEVKQALTEQMEIYKELEVTEDNKTERKKDIATLRKMIKAVNSKRIEAKKECLKPYEIFEKQASELVGIINEPIGILDSQVKEFEDKQRLQKIADINTYFDKTITGYPELIDEIGLTTIYDNRWENAGASMKSIREDIAAKLDKIQADITLIKSMPSGITEEALKLYWGELDVTRAITMINRYEQQKKEIQARLEEQQRQEKERELERERERVREEERKRIREEEHIREEERRKATEQEEAIREQERLATEQRLMGIKEPIRINNAPFDDLEAPFTASDNKTVFIITGTTEELQQVEMYLNSIGLEFERSDL